MSEFDKIIGYEKIKKEIKNILDVLVNPEKYKELGVKEPRGILLVGEPGIGKSLFAETIARETGRKTYVVRKDRPDGEFVDYITSVFDDAEKNAPSVIILDDMDKFANEDYNHRDAEEYVSIQAGIDKIKGKQVFVVATVNEFEDLPDSLSRKGRFDKIFHMSFPGGKDAADIISFYLKQKNVSDDIDAEEIARILPGRSCAELESVINEAGILAGNAGKKHIDQDDILEACLDLLLGSSREEDTIDDCGERYRIAIHEAGHAVVSEILNPGSVSLVSLNNIRRGIGGLTVSVRKELDTFESFENVIKIALAGKAATEMILAEIDVGVNHDMHKAFNLMRNLIDDNVVYGFNSWIYDQKTPEQVSINRDIVMQSELARYYLETKKIVLKNRAFIEAVANKLVEKTTITYKDIELIKRKSICCADNDKCVGAF